jgi:hypothetical protein
MNQRNPLIYKAFQNGSDSVLIGNEDCVSSLLLWSCQAPGVGLGLRSAKKNARRRDKRNGVGQESSLCRNFGF